MTVDRSKFNDLRELRKFSIGLGVILAAIGTLLLVKGRGSFIYLYAAGGLVILAGLLFSILLKPVYVLFSYVGFALGWVMTRLILTLLFFLVITPIGMVMRLLGKRFLDLSFKKKAGSYWIDKVPAEEETGGYENQF
jgi:hypothetical protein